MMMPANFSVIAENEMAYVVGGSAATDWAKTFNTNMVTIVGNTFIGKLVDVTLGTMFGGSWGATGTPSISDAMSTAFYKNGKTDKSTLNKVMATIGLGAAVYQLGTAATPSLAEDPGDVKDKNGDKWNIFLAANKFGFNIHRK